jgi:hypothetical protein
LVEGICRGWREVDSSVQLAGKPGLYLSGRVGRTVIHEQMHAGWLVASNRVPG